MHGVAIDEVLAFVVMDQPGRGPDVEGTLFIAVWGCGSRSCGLKCAPESMVGAEEVCLVPLQCVCQGRVYITKKEF